MTRTMYTCRQVPMHAFVPASQQQPRGVSSIDEPVHMARSLTLAPCSVGRQASRLQVDKRRNRLVGMVRKKPCKRTPAIFAKKNTINMLMSIELMLLVVHLKSWFFQCI